jgi:hypothetical protein
MSHWTEDGAESSFKSKYRYSKFLATNIHNAKFLYRNRHKGSQLPVHVQKYSRFNACTCLDSLCLFFYPFHQLNNFNQSLAANSFISVIEGEKRHPAAGLPVLGSGRQMSSRKVRRPAYHLFCDLIPNVYGASSGENQ